MRPVIFSLQAGSDADDRRYPVARDYDNLFEVIVDRLGIAPGNRHLQLVIPGATREPDASVTFRLLRGVGPRGCPATLIGIPLTVRYFNDNFHFDALGVTPVRDP